MYTNVSSNTGGSDGRARIDGSALLLIKFRLRGPLRFLSHAEMLRVLQRACIRAGLPLRYSEGFNPRPRLSLPLPRSVAVESDDELLCVRVGPGRSADSRTGLPCDVQAIKTALSDQLPQGCELISIELSREKSLPRPCLATYTLSPRTEYIDAGLSTRIEALLASETLMVQRCTYPKGKTRSLDVRKFLESIELDREHIVVECRVTATGSIRVEEILRLLQLETHNMAEPVRRTRVVWQRTQEPQSRP